MVLFERQMVEISEKPSAQTKTGPLDLENSLFSVDSCYQSVWSICAGLLSLVTTTFLHARGVE